jgi:hypothetical protein
MAGFALTLEGTAKWDTCLYTKSLLLQIVTFRSQIFVNESLGKNERFAGVHVRPDSEDIHESIHCDDYPSHSCHHHNVPDSGFNLASQVRCHLVLLHHLPLINEGRLFVAEVHL